LTFNNFDWNEVPSDIYSIFPLKNEPSLSHAEDKHLVSKALIQHQPWVMNTRLFFMFLLDFILVNHTIEAGKYSGGLAEMMILKPNMGVRIA
jgi:hypothetical protein